MNGDSGRFDDAGFTDMASRFLWGMACRRSLNGWLLEVDAASALFPVTEARRVGAITATAEFGNHCGSRRWRALCCDR